MKKQLQAKPDWQRGKISEAELKRLVRRGPSQVEMGRMLGKERKAMHMYLRSHDVLDLWRESRRKTKDRIAREKELSRERWISKLPERNWAERMAKGYLSKFWNRMSLKRMHGRLVAIFSGYDAARNADQRKTLEDLGAPVNAPGASVGTILERVGLPSLNWNARTRKRRLIEVRRAPTN